MLRHGRLYLRLSTLPDWGLVASGSWASRVDVMGSFRCQGSWTWILKCTGPGGLGRPRSAGALKDRSTAASSCYEGTSLATLKGYVPTCIKPRLDNGPVGVYQARGKGAWPQAI
jgi:hypothetical protein